MVEAVDEDVVRLQRRGEVDERLLIRKQLQQHFVRNGLVQGILKILDLRVHVTQVAEEEHRRVPEKTEHEAVPLAWRTHPTNLVEEGVRHRRRLRTDCDHALAKENNAQRQGFVGEHALVVLVTSHRQRHVHNDEVETILTLKTRTFLAVKRIVPA